MLCLLWIGRGFVGESLCSPSYTTTPAAEQGKWGATELGVVKGAGPSETRRHHQQFDCPFQLLRGMYDR
jgi:hypothetical protein